MELSCKYFEKKLHKYMFPPFSQILSSILSLTRPYKKMIFVASTGRSGTKSLSYIFETIPNMCARHEPFPVMNDFVMKQRNSGNHKPSIKLYRQSKRNMIRLGQLFGNKYYSESNHIFIKSFASEALDEFKDKITVVHLYRDPVSVAKSIFELGSIPGTEKGDRWFLNYSAKENFIQISNLLETNEFSHNYYKCLWYWYEIEARTTYYREKYSHINFIDISTNDLGNVEKVINLLRKLELPYNVNDLKKVINIKHNQKKEKKKSKLPLDKARTMHNKFIAALYENGILEGIDINGLPIFKKSLLNKQNSKQLI